MLDIWNMMINLSPDWADLFEQEDKNKIDFSWGIA